MKRKMIFIAPLAIVGFAVFIAIGGLLVMLLWNWLAPTLFGWRPVTFGQAVGLLALCRILFGRSGFSRGMRRGSWRHRGNGAWTRMSPEEREQMRRRLWERVGGSVPPESPSNL